MAFVHEFLRETRDGIKDQLSGFEGGSLRVMDIGVSPPKDVSQQTINRLQNQLHRVEDLIQEHGESDA